METIRITNDSNGQKIILPPEYKLQGKEVFIKKIGKDIIVFTKKGGWKSLTDSLSKFSEDFMKERIQPEIEQREKLFK
jgi:antitoxin VapB